jgi:hemerythrin-like metal-binding protein
MGGATEVPELIHWGPAFSVGISNFDGHHRAFVYGINEFHSAMVSGRSNEILDYVLDRLIQGAAEHFAAEEHVLEAHAYPGLEVHRYEHRKFLNAVRKFHQDFRAGKAVPTVDVMFFLRDWLKNHIQGTDQRYVPFLKEKGVS